MTLARCVSPHRGFAGWLANSLANARFLKRLRRALTARLPFPVLRSEVSDIIYANWVVPVAAVAHLIPPGVVVVEVDGRTILTVLTYAHGHFGPALLGPLRRLFPSPLQSNWRLYVRSIAGERPADPTVLFVANIFDSGLYALGTRLFSDVMLSHHAARFEHGRAGDEWLTRISGGGSAPSVDLSARAASERALPPPFAPFFASYAEALTSICLQDAAIAPVPDIGALAVSRIDLPIDVASVTPLAVERYRPGELLTRLGATSRPFCFRVPGVTFRVLSEGAV